MSRRPYRRCSRHDLAIAPDGLCVLCRRDSRASVEPVAVPDDRQDPPRWLGVFMVVTACGLMAWPIVDSHLKTVQASPVSTAGAQAPVARAPERVVEAAKGEPRVAPKLDRQVEAAAAPETSVSAASDTTELGSSQQPSEPERAKTEREQKAASAHERNAALELERKRELEQRVQRRHERSKRERQAQTLAAARRDVNITLYSTRWCNVCQRARAYMQAEHIAFTELDVEGDKAARARQRALNPRGSVPTIAVDDQVLVGFSVAALESRIDRAARRRSATR